MSDNQLRRIDAQRLAGQQGARQNLGVAGKLWLAFGLLVLVLALSGVVSYRSLQRIDRDLLRLVAVEEPLKEAVLEMEINAGESARAVLDYVRELAPEHIEAIQDSEADFERFAAKFKRLAETDDERRLGREVAALYVGFKALGDEIVALADRRRGALEAFRRNVLEIDELIDDKFQKLIDMTVPDAAKKLHSALEMEINIGEAFAAIEGYVLHPDATRRAEVIDAEADFERFQARYRETSLSAEETGWLERIDREFAEAVNAGNRIMTVTDRLNAGLDQFETYLKTIDAILDDEIQPLIHAETVAAADDAKTSTHTAALYLLVLGLAGLCIASVSAWIIWRDIIGPIRVLVAGTDIVAGGGLAHRIEVKATGEIGRLAAAFNRMVANLEKSAALLRGNEARLRAVVETAVDGIITIDEHGIIESFNNAAEEIFGYAADEAVGGNFNMLMPEPYRSEHDGYLTRHLDERESDVFGSRREVVGRRKDGTTFPMELAVSNAYLGDRGLFTGIVRDISERKEAAAALRAAHDNLERRVVERTAELASVNTRLQSEIDERKCAEAALRDSRTRFRDFADASSDWFWEMDADLRFSYFSDRFTEVTGVPQENLLGKTRQESPIPDVDPEAWETHLENLAAHRQFRGFQHSRIHPDGHVIHLSIDGKPWFGEAGDFKGFRGSGCDITERKKIESELQTRIAEHEKTEAALKESEARFKNFAEISADWFWEMDADLRFSYMSDGYFKVFGTTPGDVLGKTRGELVGERQIAGNPEKWRRHFEDMEAHRPIRGTEFVREGPDGTERHLILDCVPVFNDKGEFRGYRGNTKDITDRKLAELALREIQQRLNAIMNSVVDAVITYDADGNIQSYNRAAERIFGPSMIQALQMKVSDLIPEEYFHNRDDYINKLRLGEDEIYTSERPEVTGRRDDGTTFPLELSVSRMDVPGKSMLVAICRDITERIRAEEEQTVLEQRLRQSQKMESIGQLTGGIAHDFNNLLMIIDGYARRTLKNLGDLEVAGRSLEEVLAATEKAARLTKQLLVFSRRQIMEKRVFRVDDVLRDLKALLPHAVGEFYDFRFEAADRKMCVRTDPAELTQAIINLAVNARDAMPKGGTISIAARVVEVSEEHTSIHASMAPGRYVRLSVTDQGSGIDTETLQHIFEPFFTTKEQGEGTGLGLAMVHGFAEQSGGAVDVESVLDEGTTVSIFLPVVDQLPDEIAASVEQEYCGKGETILLVEDDDRLLELTYDMLRDLGYTVFVAANGLEALEIEDELDGAINLLVSDVVMPSLGGFELYEILREKRPDLRAVFMSGYPARGTGKVEIPKNAPLLQKPVGPNQFAQAIRIEIDKTDAKLCA